MSPSVSGEGGHDRLYAAACKTVELGCSWAEAHHVLKRAFNPNCRPPWSERELKHKVNQAFANKSTDTSLEKHCRLSPSVTLRFSGSFLIGQIYTSGLQNFLILSTKTISV